ncbi:MAG: phenylacetate--CoA ligase family protein, partial [Halobacteriovoraceae bacterium]|nr:phenylacetate--CoA ligase family protein [Halobacteriovoraceae bacterium]
HSIIKDSAFLSPKASSGYVYSSGGTTGDPKFCFYSYEEFNHVAQMLGQAYHEMGVREGVRVANLFMAGNMWSSFNAVQAGLRYCKSIQYPIGGLVNAKDFKYYIKNFKIKIVFGLPSLLLDLANKVPDLEIDQIFYAGEAFSKDGEDFIKSVWKVKSFHSAGYASVDVGPIGYQTLDCHDGEHYLFDDQLHLEVVDDEAIITSKVRKMMPVIRYRTGDRVEIIEKTNGRTKFKLLGRVDKKVNIWSSRFEMNDLKKLMQQMDYHGQFQIQLKSTTVENNYKDLMCLVLSEPMAITPAEFLEQFYLSMHDVAQTHAVKFLEDKLILSYGDFYINKRTGKFKDLIDFR